MKVDSTEVEVKSGAIISLRSPQKEDAEALLHLVSTIFNDDSYYLAAYPEERVLTIEKELAYIESVNADERGFLLLSECDGQLVATCQIAPLMRGIKTNHRAICSLSVKKEYRNLGIGYQIMKASLDEVRKLSYQQVELEVVSTNHAAIKLYKKLGFVETGKIEYAYKLKDGSYQSLIQMMIRLV